MCPIVAGHRRLPAFARRCAVALAAGALGLGVVASAPSSAHVPAPATLWWAPARGAGPVRFAGGETDRYLRAMGVPAAGARPGRRPARALPAGLIVARSPAAVERARRATLGRAPTGDGYALAIGRGWARVEARSPRGALYGAYAYLKRLGVRFFAPRLPFYRGIGSELVPRRPAAPAPQRVTSSPAFPIRRIDIGRRHMTPARLIAVADWAAKQGINTLLLPLPAASARAGHDWAAWRTATLPALRRRGFLLEGGQIGYADVLHRARYARRHPGWFFGSRPNDAFCASAPGALRAYASHAVALARRFPELSTLDVWPPDMTRWCPRDLRAIGSPPAIQARVVRAVYARVRAAGLPVRVETIAYDGSRTLRPPRGALPRGVQVDFAPFHRSFAAPLWGRPNARYWSALRAWRHAEPHVGSYTYYIKGKWLSRPVLIPHLIARELRRLSAVGLDATSSYADPSSWLAYEVDHLAVAAYSWNPALPYRRFVADYTAHRFAGAAPSVRRYLRDTELGARALFVNAHGAFGSPSRLTATLGHWRVATHALARAQRSGGASPARRRLLARLATSLRIGELDLEAALAQHSGRPATATERAADRLTRRVARRGLVESILPRRRGERASEPAATRW